MGDTDSGMSSEQRTVLERHAQTVISVVVAGLIGWVGVSVSDSRTMIARLDERVSTLSIQLQEMRDSVNGRYRRADADRDFGVVTTRLDRIEKRVERLEEAR